MNHALTERELHILRLRAQGKTGPEIAAALFLSPNTVNTHQHRIHLKLGARTIAHAVAIAKNRRII